ncbi:rhamnogalacturonan acetylesterase [Asticcacaulis sp. AND118]|uniref:rhamnogalacturonan acetylesterase n=1 Tax=Asticcacaulis sp. AND118 TaxID=2840468 RepID=UPI001CFFDFC1|nr:rhamnogalacturonan acetylesterase [Asticcacaulis sp. AND118]UDF03350.1 rhamnogalacturonan acetylesterase [Asticcacaulis sp. AND118]
MITNNQKNETRKAVSVAVLALVFSLGAAPVLAQTAAQTTPSETTAAVTTAPQRFLLDGTAKADASAVRLTPDMAYDAARGYGFTNTRGGNETALAVKAAPGDYRVRVTLGSKIAASRTSVWAEDRRLMLAPVVLKKGETKTIEFLVNVRDPSVVTSEQDAKGKAPRVGLRGDEDTSRTWDDRLTIAFSGPTPAVQSVEITPVKARRVLIAGDSTVTDQGGTDYASWGQMLPRFLSNDVAVANHARSGETMKSFVTSLRWDKLLSDLRAGDVVLIQFGHNDQKKQWPRTYVDAEHSYPAWLRAFAADVQTRGGKVVLISPVSRRFFNTQGTIDNSLAGYDDAVRKVAAELNVPFIDLTAKTKTMYEALGPDVSPLAFGNGGQDKTHHNAYGAYQIANYVAQTIVAPQSGLDLKAAPDFKTFDPAHPADPKAYDLTPADWPVMREVAGKISGN